MYGETGAGPSGLTGKYYNSSTSGQVSPGNAWPGTGGGSGYANYNQVVCDGMPGGSGYVWFLYFNPNK